MVLLGKLDELTLAHIVAKPKPLLAHARADLDILPPPPDPVTIDGKEEYKVDHIRDSKMFGRTLKYLVRWKGYGEGEDTWEPLSNLANSSQVVKEFHSQNPGAPRSINALLYASLPWQPLYEHTANADVVP